MDMLRNQSKEKKWQQQRRSPEIRTTMRSPGQTEIGERAAITHLMDDANAVPGTERNRYPW